MEITHLCQDATKQTNSISKILHTTLYPLSFLDLVH